MAGAVTSVASWSSITLCPTRQAAATVETIEFRCRAHNQYEAELWFGAADQSLARESRALYIAGNCRDEVIASLQLGPGRALAGT